MKIALGALCKVNAGLAAALKVLLVVLFVLLAVDVIWGVAGRYLLGSQPSWSEELARLLMVWLALLATALVCREDGHLGLDVLTASWPEEVQRLSQLFVILLIISFAAAIMSWGGWQLVEQRFASGQKLPALGVARGWFYLALPVSGILITIFMVENFCATLMKTRGDQPS
jgi:TRAP-type C4-dicarboxylate transport system permease small subunit